LIAYDGVDGLDLLGAFEPVAKARDAGHRIVPEILGVQPALRTSSGVVIHPSAGWSAVPRCAALVVPGGRGAVGAAADPDLAAQLREFASRRNRLYAVCTGAALLAQLGLLEGMTVAVHHLKSDLLSGVADCRVTAGAVRDGWLYSVGGWLSGAGVKGVEAGLQVLRDLCPQALSGVLEQMEVSATAPCLEVRAWV
jgi:putative intracellular protease/amidase